MFNIDLDIIYWRLKSGKPIRKGSIYDLRHSNYKEINKPIFFLSTGRCGTKWFSDLFAMNKKSLILHSPIPVLSVQSVYAYKALKKNNLNPKEEMFSALREMFLAGREEYLRYTFKTGKRYIETNNSITFFAPILAKIFPDALFIHLHRHPAEFVRSAIRRKYYTDAPEDFRRIKPIDNDKWKEYSQIEKSSWLWNETNSFIEEFKKSTDSNRIIDYSLNYNTTENILQLLDFLGIDMQSKQISKMLDVKSNKQVSGSFPKYQDWNEKDKEGLKAICLQLSNKYNYTL